MQSQGLNIIFNKETAENMFKLRVTTTRSVYNAHLQHYNLKTFTKKKTIYAVETSVVNVRNSQETKSQTKKFSVKFKKKILVWIKGLKRIF